MKYLIMALLLTGCAGTFNTALHQLPSVQNCRSVKYVREGNQVVITAHCEIPMKSSPLIDIPAVP